MDKDTAESWAGYEAPVVKTRTLHEVRVVAQRMIEAASAVATAKTSLDTATSTLGEIRDRELPDVMRGAGVTKVELEGLGMLSAAPEVYGSIPSADKDPVARADALAWMIEHEPAIVKRFVEVALPRDLPNTIDERTEAEISKIVAELRDPENTTSIADAICYIINELVPAAEVTVDLSVHHATLTAWAREKIANGVDIPLRKLGLTAVTRAKITNSTRTRNPKTKKDERF